MRPIPAPQTGEFYFDRSGENSSDVDIGIGSIGLLWLVCWTIIAIVITILELLGWKSSKEGGMIAAFRVTIFEILITILELFRWKPSKESEHVR